MGSLAALFAFCLNSVFKVSSVAFAESKFSFCSLYFTNQPNPKMATIINAPSNNLRGAGHKYAVLKSNDFDAMIKPLYFFSCCELALFTSLELMVNFCTPFSVLISTNCGTEKTPVLGKERINEATLLSLNAAPVKL